VAHHVKTFPIHRVNTVRLSLVTRLRRASERRCCTLPGYSRITPGFHHSVAVLPLAFRRFPLRKFRKNYVAYVKNSVAPLPLIATCCCAVGLTAVP